MFLLSIFHLKAYVKRMFASGYGFNRSMQYGNFTQVKDVVLQMKQRPRIYYTESQKALMWEHWNKGESLHQIPELFDRHYSLIHEIFAESYSAIYWPQVQQHC
jgi:hypothetical protein